MRVPDILCTRPTETGALCIEKIGKGYGYAARTLECTDSLHTGSHAQDRESRNNARRLCKWPTSWKCEPIITYHSYRLLM
jgi:hypothetical protein